MMISNQMNEMVEVFFDDSNGSSYGGNRDATDEIISIDAEDSDDATVSYESNIPEVRIDKNPMQGNTSTSVEEPQDNTSTSAEEPDDSTAEETGDHVEP